MLVSKQFLRSFAELANRYQWDKTDIAEIKEATRADPELRFYWETLAEAHRNGYEQTKQNGHIRLFTWINECDQLRPLFIEEKARLREMGKI